MGCGYPGYALLAVWRVVRSVIGSSGDDSVRGVRSKMRGLGRSALCVGVDVGVRSFFFRNSSATFDWEGSIIWIFGCCGVD